MIRHAWKKVAGAVLSMACAAAASGAPSDTMPRALARDVAGKTVELVEARAVYPRRQADYDQAKARLQALLDGSGEVEREALFARLRELLGTLDADGHSMLIPAGAQLTVPQAPQAPPPPPSFSLVATDRGAVLRWTPPAIMGGETLYAGYLNTFHDAAAAHPEFAEACALLVDLSAQTGGNALPPLIAMRPLFGAANKANIVDRDGGRHLFMDRAYLDAQNLKHGGAGRTNPLARFASGPLAVLVGDQTSSAGEMLLVALMGEARVQTFGRTSQGLSTANNTYVLADGSTLVLTEMRYAVGDGPVFRKGIAPMHPATEGEPWDATVKAAAQWAAASSPQCKAG